MTKTSMDRRYQRSLTDGLSTSAALCGILDAYGHRRFPRRFPGARNHGGDSGSGFIQSSFQNGAAALEERLVIGIVVEIAIADRHAISLEDRWNELGAL